MTKPSWKVLILLLVTVLAAGSLWACSTQTTTTTTDDSSESAAVESDSAAATEADTPAPVDTEAEADTDAVAAAAESTVAEESAAAETETGTAQTFVIDQSQSVASFTLDEELMGAPTTVVGTTSLVSGEIQIDPANPSATTVGTIQIDASDFTTDSDRRNGAIRRFILQTNDAANQYITFTPSNIEGLPDAVTVGDSFTIQITGDLTISGVTNPVTFETVITVDADNQISGTATTEVLRSDFNLTIPSVPSVANVTDEVQLQLDFVAGA